MNYASNMEEAMQFTLAKENDFQWKNLYMRRYKQCTYPPPLPKNPSTTLGHIFPQRKDLSQFCADADIIHDEYMMNLSDTHEAAVAAEANTHNAANKMEKRNNASSISISNSNKDNNKNTMTKMTKMKKVKNNKDNIVRITSPLSEKNKEQELDERKEESQESINKSNSPESNKKSNNIIKSRKEIHTSEESMKDEAEEIDALLSLQSSKDKSEMSVNSSQTEDIFCSSWTKAKSSNKEKELSLQVKHEDQSETTQFKNRSNTVNHKNDEIREEEKEVIEEEEEDDEDDEEEEAISNHSNSENNNNNGGNDDESMLVDEDDERALVTIFGFLQHRRDRFSSANSSMYQWSASHLDRSCPTSNNIDNNNNMSFGYTKNSFLSRYGDGEEGEWESEEQEQEQQEQTEELMQRECVSFAPYAYERHTRRRRNPYSLPRHLYNLHRDAWIMLMDNRSLAWLDREACEQGEKTALMRRQLLSILEGSSLQHLTNTTISSKAASLSSVKASSASSFLLAQMNANLQENSLYLNEDRQEQPMHLQERDNRAFPYSTSNNDNNYMNKEMQVHRPREEQEVLIEHQPHQHKMQLIISNTEAGERVYESFLPFFAIIISPRQLQRCKEMYMNSKRMQEIGLVNTLCDHVGLTLFSQFATWREAYVHRTQWALTPFSFYFIHDSSFNYAQVSAVCILAHILHKYSHVHSTQCLTSLQSTSMRNANLQAWSTQSNNNNSTSSSSSESCCPYFMLRQLVENIILAYEQSNARTTLNMITVVLDFLTSCVINPEITEAFLSRAALMRQSIIHVPGLNTFAQERTYREHHSGDKNNDGNDNKNKSNNKKLLNNKTNMNYKKEERDSGETNETKQGEHKETSQSTSADLADLFAHKRFTEVQFLSLFELSYWFVDAASANRHIPVEEALLPLSLQMSHARVQELREQEQEQYQEQLELNELQLEEELEEELELSSSERYKLANSKKRKYSVKNNKNRNNYSGNSNARMNEIAGKVAQPSQRISLSLPSLTYDKQINEKANNNNNNNNSSSARKVSAEVRRSSARHKRNVQNKNNTKDAIKTSKGNVAEVEGQGQKTINMNKNKKRVNTSAEIKTSQRNASPNVHELWSTPKETTLPSSAERASRSNSNVSNGSNAAMNYTECSGVNVAHHRISQDLSSSQHKVDSSNMSNPYTWLENGHKHTHYLPGKLQVCKAVDSLEEAMVLFEMKRNANHSNSTKINYNSNKKAEERQTDSTIRNDDDDDEKDETDEMSSNSLSSSSCCSSSSLSELENSTRKHKTLESSQRAQPLQILSSTTTMLATPLITLLTYTRLHGAPWLKVLLHRLFNILRKESVLLYVNRLDLESAFKEIFTRQHSSSSSSSPEELSTSLTAGASYSSSSPFVMNREESNRPFSLSTSTMLNSHSTVEFHWNNSLMIQQQQQRQQMRNQILKHGYKPAAAPWEGTAIGMTPSPPPSSAMFGSNHKIKLNSSQREFVQRMEHLESLICQDILYVMNEFFNSLYGSRSASRLPAGLTTLIATFCDIIHLHLLNEMVSGSGNNSSSDKQYTSHTYHNAKEYDGNNNNEEEMGGLFSNANKQKYHKGNTYQNKSGNRHGRYTSAHEMNSSAAQHKISELLYYLKQKQNASRAFRTENSTPNSSVHKLITTIEQYRLIKFILFDTWIIPALNNTVENGYLAAGSSLHLRWNVDAFARYLKIVINSPFVEFDRPTSTSLRESRANEGNVNFTDFSAVHVSSPPPPSSQLCTPFAAHNSDEYNNNIKNKENEKIVNTFKNEIVTSSTRKFIPPLPPPIPPHKNILSHTNTKDNKRINSREVNSNRRANRLTGNTTLLHRENTKNSSATPNERNLSSENATNMDYKHNSCNDNSDTEIAPVDSLTLPKYITGIYDVSSGMLIEVHNAEFYSSVMVSATETGSADLRNRTRAFQNEPEQLQLPKTSIPTGVPSTWQTCNYGGYYCYYNTYNDADNKCNATMELSNTENMNSSCTNNNYDKPVYTNAFNERNGYLPPITSSSSLPLNKNYNNLVWYDLRCNCIYYKSMDHAPWEQLSTSLRNLNEALGLVNYDPEERTEEEELEEILLRTASNISSATATTSAVVQQQQQQQHLLSSVMSSSSAFASAAESITSAPDNASEFSPPQSTSASPSSSLSPYAVNPPEQQQPNKGSLSSPMTSFTPAQRQRRLSSIGLATKRMTAMRLLDLFCARDCTLSGRSAVVAEFDLPPSIAATSLQSIYDFISGNHRLVRQAMRHGLLPNKHGYSPYLSCLHGVLLHPKMAALVLQNVETNSTSFYETLVQPLRDASLLEMVSALANGGENSYHGATIPITDNTFDINNNYNMGGTSISGGGGVSSYVHGAHGYDARSLSHGTTQLMESHMSGMMIYDAENLPLVDSNSVFPLLNMIPTNSNNNQNSKNKFGAQNTNAQRIQGNAANLALLYGLPSQNALVVSSSSPSVSKHYMQHLQRKWEANIRRYRRQQLFLITGATRFNPRLAQLLNSLTIHDPARIMHTGKCLMEHELRYTPMCFEPWWRAMVLALCMKATSVFHECNHSASREFTSQCSRAMERNTRLQRHWRDDFVKEDGQDENNILPAELIMKNGNVDTSSTSHRGQGKVRTSSLSTSASRSRLSMQKGQGKHKRKAKNRRQSTQLNTRGKETSMPKRFVNEELSSAMEDVNE